MKKQLYRSTNNKVISGVCGGIAEYFEIDPTIIRLLWVLITFTRGIGLIAYIICMIVIPENTFSYKVNNSENTETNTTYFTNESNPSDENSKMLFGVILVILGVILIAKKFIYWFDLGNLWAILLVIAGVYLIFKEKGGKINEKK